MSHSVVALVLLTVLQSFLLGILVWPPSTLLDEENTSALLPFNPDTIDEIHLGDDYDNEIILLRIGEHWILPDEENLPVDRSMVEAMINSLAEAHDDWPVAKSTAARQRFQVAAYHYQRRLTLIGKGELLGTVYLGTAPAFRRVHSRNDAQNAIYSIVYNTFDAPATRGGWLDKSLLQVRTPLHIRSAQYDLQRDGDVWLSSWGATPEPGELQALVDALRELQIKGLANEDMQRTLSMAEPELRLDITSLGGQQTLELFQVAGEYFIYHSRYPVFFSLADSDFQSLTTIDVKRLRGEQPPASTATSDTQQ